MANQEEAALEIDDSLQELITLAERVVGRGDRGFFTATPSDSDAGRLARDWLPCFRDARLLQKELQDAGTERAQGITIGKFFSARLNRAVPISVGDRVGTATLRTRGVRANQRLYWLEVVWDGAEPMSTPAPPTSSRHRPGDSGRHHDLCRQSAARAVDSANGPRQSSCGAIGPSRRRRKRPRLGRLMVNVLGGW